VSRRAKKRDPRRGNAAVELYDRVSLEALDLFLTDAQQAFAKLTTLRRRMLRARDLERATACLFLMVSAAQVSGNSKDEVRVARLLARERPSMRTLGILATALSSVGQHRSALLAFRTALKLAGKTERQSDEYAALQLGADRCRRELQGDE
jgi:hypothetical protein